MKARKGQSNKPDKDPALRLPPKTEFVPEVKAVVLMGAQSCWHGHVYVKPQVSEEQREDAGGVVPAVLQKARQSGSSLGCRQGRKMSMEFQDKEASVNIEMLPQGPQSWEAAAFLRALVKPLRTPRITRVLPAAGPAAEVTCCAAPVPAAVWAGS